MKSLFQSDWITGRTTTRNWSWLASTIAEKANYTAPVVRCACSCRANNTLHQRDLSSRGEVTTTSPVRNIGVFYCLRMTCRHFRYQVPREYADELRDADPEPCPVCDVLPHREARATKKAVVPAYEQIEAQPVGASNWFTRWLGKREEILPVIRAPARFSA